MRFVIAMDFAKYILILAIMALVFRSVFSRLIDSYPEMRMILLVVMVAILLLVATTFLARLEKHRTYSRVLTSLQ